MKYNVMIFFFIVISVVHSSNYNIYQGRYIENVVLEHDKGISDKDEDIKIILRTERGTTFSIKNVNDDIKDLWDLGLFNDIRVFVEPGDIGVIVKFYFENKFLLNKVYFTGNEVSEKRLIEKAELTPSKRELPKYVDDYIAVSSVNNLKKFYMKRGNFSVKIDYRIEEIDETSADLHFDIEEGKKFFISDIVIEGNEKHETNKILSELKIRKRGLFRSGYYDEKKVEDGLNNLRNFYKKNGYISSEIDLRGVEIDRNNIKLIIDVFEGEQFVIGDIQIDLVRDDDPIISKDHLLSDISKVKDSPFSDVGFDEIIGRLRSQYTDLGYLSVMIEGKKVFDLAQSKVNLLIRINEGEQAFINEVFIQSIGDKMKTKTWVLAREMLLSEGDPFSVKKLQETQQRLFNLNYFDTIYPIYTPIPNTNKLDLTWYAKEKPTGRAQIGGGYSNAEGLIGFIELGEYNLLGRGFKLNFKYERSKQRNDFNINFTDPWFLNPRFLKSQYTFGFDIYRITYDRYELFYKELKNGISLKFGKVFKRYYQVFFEIRHDEIRLEVEDQHLGTAPPDVINNLGWNVTNAFSIGIVRDKRDYFFNPTSGSRFSINTTLAGDFIKGNNDNWSGLGGNAHYLKMVMQGEYYIPTFWKFILGLRTQFGFIQSFSSQKLPPIYERFFLGGDYSIRGYQERSIGYTELAWARDNWSWEYAIWDDGTKRWIIVNPDNGDWIDPYTGIKVDKDTGRDKTKKIGDNYYTDYGVSYYPIGGTKIFNFNAEYKFPIYNKLWGAFFYDAGYIWTDIFRDINGDGVLEKIYSEPLSLNNFKLVQAVGFGIRFEVPMLGVLRLDYGIGLSHPTYSEVGRNYSNTRLHFTIGNVF